MSSPLKVAESGRLVVDRLISLSQGLAWLMYSPH